MQTVNEGMLNDILNPLGGTGDIDEEIEKYRKFDSNDELKTKQIILLKIKPYYDNRSDEYKASLKRSLAYFLTTNRINYGRLYDSCLIAFDHPDDPRDFFLWIWQVLFLDETYNLSNVDEYQELNDPYEARRYFSS